MSSLYLKYFKMDALDIGCFSSVNITFPDFSISSDPINHPVFIIGQLVNLNKIKYDDVRHKFEDRVSEEVSLCVFFFLGGVFNVFVD